MQLFYRSTKRSLTLSFCVTLYTREDVGEIKKKKKKKKKKRGRVKERKGGGRKKKEESEEQEENKNLIKCSLSVAYTASTPLCTGIESLIHFGRPAVCILYNPLFFRNSRKIVLSARFVRAETWPAYETREDAGLSSL